MKSSTLIALIAKAIPEALPVPIKEWDRNSTGEGIWFRGSEEYAADGSRIFDYYNDERMVHPVLQKLLDDNGFYASPYDSGTLMAYK